MPSTTTIARPLQLLIRAMQWGSAVIVMGLTSFFISRGPRGQHIIYQEVIAVLSVVFFLPAFISPFMPNRLSKFVVFIDIVFSYLWLTAFIFAAQDYNLHSCIANAPPGVTCGRKKANEAFMFLAFISTLFGLFLEVYLLWGYHKENNTTPGHPEKIENGAQPSVDAPATTTAAGAV
ncbi:uncharacterized protein N7515_000723 [Penicillium bovifimosum]|uniref:MARVEL domain-containing protein n=1 Tax=Penicillium bovifimosum TaxID=126998 RepID=A0A9W9HFJ8_9EURO|nr:uncharacterized protein N7515_000723 [Penicillium bovifimosum]KAJ5146159.1 hypothetical protein N7515_000723 [Penicillium bovifimosum]